MENKSNPQSQAQLYASFKKLEKQIQSKINELSVIQLIEGVLLEKTYNIVSNLVKDLLFCYKKNIVQRLWGSIRAYLGTFLEKHNEDFFLVNIDKFYDRHMKLMRILIKSLLEQYTQGKLEKNEDNQVISRVCVYYGQVLQSRQKTASLYGLPKNEKSIQQTSNFYLKAIGIYPYNGSFYSRLAVMTAFNYDLFSAYYWSMRAKRCQKPQPIDQKLLQVLKQQQLDYIFKDTFSSLKSMCLHLAIYHQSHNNSFIEWNDLLKDVMHNLHKPNETFLSVLSYGIHLCLQSVYEIAFTGNLKRPYYQLKEDFTAKSIIRNNFYIILSFFEIFNKIQDTLLKSASIIITPVINFWILFPNIFKLLLQDFVDLQSNIIFIYSRYLALKTKDRLIYKIFSHETNLLGWTVLSEAFQNRKKQLEKDDDVVYSWIVDSLKLLGVDLEGKSSLIKVKYPAAIKIKVEKLNGTKQKNLIVVDGRNVAIRHGNHEFFSSKGLKIVADYWQERGYQIVIILPQYCFSIKQIQRRKEQQLNLKTLPDDIGPIIKLRSQGIAKSVPDRDYDDAYIIEYAMNKQAFILSNDNFNDFKQHSKLPAGKKSSIREFFKNHLMSYTFIADDFIPNPEFKKSKNIV